jgi:hypothetical protein
MFRLSLALVAALPLLHAADPRRVESVTSQRVDFAPGGLIRIQASSGELNIEGWDENAVEMTVTRYIFSADETKAKQELDKVQVSKLAPSGAELTVSETHKRTFGVHVDYRIRVPRNSKLDIRHGIGDILIDDVTGDIDAYARTGGIVLQLPADGSYSIDARNKLGGSIDSDFGGATHHIRPLFGGRLESNPPGAAHHLKLRVGEGGIQIQKLAPVPAPAS